MTSPIDPSFPSPKSSETVVRGQCGKDTRRTSKIAKGEAPPWVEGDQLGDFVLEQFLGRGSSGFVYRVFNAKTNQRHALKLLIPDSPEDLVRNKCGFRRMRTMNHPGLVRVHRLHRLDDYVGLTMEEVRGVTLNAYVKDLVQLPRDERWTRLLQLTRQYAAVLAYLHARGLVHRDIKPPNLMVDHEGNGRVVDYGLVGTFDPQEDPNGFRHYYVGSPNYLAPETCWDRYYLPAGDVFSLGISILQVMRAIGGRDDIPRSEHSRQKDGEMIQGALEELDTSVPGLLRDACKEMLALLPGDRPTALEISRLGLPATAVIDWTPAAELFGRDTELEQLHGWVRLISRGGSGRLHIRGDSGMGKTQLIDELLKKYPKNGWVQVFDARCVPREDQPLQALDQIVDQVVSRFMKSDREPIKMDVVSTSVLHESFAVLASMIVEDENLRPMDNSSNRLDALEAAVRLAKGLVRLGPMIVIIDDVHWADQDSLNCLDALQSSVGENFGIITVSRGADSGQRLPADSTLTLNPLSDESSLEWLRSVAMRWKVEVPDAALRHWVSVCGGCPLDLRLVADELKPGGLLSDANEDYGVRRSVGRRRLWRRHIELLSLEGRQALQLVCVAGRDVSYRQLGELTGAGESIDVVISELAHQRLILDEAIDSGYDAPDRECVRLVHASVAEGVLATMESSKRMAAHRAWANHLLRLPTAERFAARIAGHLFDAEEPARAVSHAIVAAEEAEKRGAMTEAARWRERVLPMLTGQELEDQVRETARCFNEADRPDESARYFLQLAAMVQDSDEQIDLELTAVTQMLRCGQITNVRPHLGRLAARLKAPTPKNTKWRSLASLLWGACKLRMVTGPFYTVPPPGIQVASDDPARRRDRQSLKMCLELVRPMSMLDNLYAAELSVAGAIAVRTRGTEAQVLYSSLGSAIFGSYLPGHSREASHRLADDLKPRVQQLNDSKLWGDFYGVKAFQQMYQCSWNESLQPMSEAVTAYRSCSESYHFEIMHTRWIELWGAMKTGQIQRFVQTASDMFEIATTKNDRFGWFLSTGGIASAAWLAKDNTKAIDGFQDQAFRSMKQMGPQWVDVFNWLAEMQSLAYEGRWDQILSKTNHAKASFLTSMCRNYQLLQVLYLETVTRASLCLAEATPSNELPQKRIPSNREISRLIGRLRKESLPYATALADYFQGRHESARGNFELATEALTAAVEASRRLRLTPLMLASEDLLDQISHGQISHGKQGHRLTDHLREEGVVWPEKFQRLYV